MQSSFSFLCMHSLTKWVLLGFLCYYENDIFMHTKSKFKQHRKRNMSLFHSHTQFHCPEVTIPSSSLCRCVSFWKIPVHIICLYIYLSKTHTHSNRYRDTNYFLSRWEYLCAILLLLTNMWVILTISTHTDRLIAFLLTALKALIAWKYLSLVNNFAMKGIPVSGQYNQLLMEDACL